jgi:hypothetical protein
MLLIFNEEGSLSSYNDAAAAAMASEQGRLKEERAKKGTTRKSQNRDEMNMKKKRKN